jgi:RiboL-PSP-HEPN
MPTEFDVICDEFSSELDALSEMAVNPAETGQSGVTPRARVSAGNAAVLLLAAIFEEYVRQQVRAAFRDKCRSARGISDFPAKIASTVWRRSLEALARTPFEDIESDRRKTDERLSTTVSFCLKKEITADVSVILSHNDTNMRLQELGRLFNQIGLPSIILSACESADLMDFLGADTPGKANVLLEARINEFFRRRNEIAHAIQLGSSSGPTELLQDIKMFRLLGRSLAEAVQRRALVAADGGP